MKRTELKSRYLCLLSFASNFIVQRARSCESGGQSGTPVAVLLGLILQLASPGCGR